MREKYISQIREKTTPHIDRLIERGNKSIELQFKNTISRFENKSCFISDPLHEDSLYSPIKGVVHKFPNRLLWKVSYECAAHCQFCTRRRQIGSKKGNLRKEDIQNGLDYILKHKEIDDVILSGGDPFYTPKITEFLIKKLDKIKSVKVIRIGTRLPINSPDLINDSEIISLLDTIGKITRRKPVFVLIHAEHPSEITPGVKKFVRKTREAGAILLSQTVFLKGINDNVEVLSLLFTSLYHMGVVPYYIYRCDYVRGLERFICPIQKERLIMTKLRKTLSGIAVPTYVIDVPGRGKVPIPLKFWKGMNISECFDFDGKKINI